MHSRTERFLTVLAFGLSLPILVLPAKIYAAAGDLYQANPQNGSIYE